MPSVAQKPVRLIRVANESHPAARVARTRANAYLRQSYPLSGEGVAVREALLRLVGPDYTVTAESLIRFVDELPTVERPRSELFADFDVSAEVADFLFGALLSTVQVTKGCTHDCTYCGIPPATRTITSMPYAAQLKIAEHMRAFEQRLEVAWSSWVALLKNQTGFDTIEESARLTDEGHWRLTRDFLAAAKLVHPGHAVAQLLPSAALLHGVPIEKLELLSLMKTVHYYDSDPMDYCDRTFVHEDGTPADYGDVVALLASPWRIVEISTAGWPQWNRIAQRAAEKVAALWRRDPRVFDALHFRLSITDTEWLARHDMDRYVRSMRNVIETFRHMPLRVQVSVSQHAPSDFRHVVVEPIAALVEQIRNDRHTARYKPYTKRQGVSHYSGRAKQLSALGDVDIGRCMTGVHVWPDGTVAYQGDQSHPYGPMHQSSTLQQVPKGSRPTPIGMRLFGQGPSQFATVTV